VRLFIIGRCAEQSGDSALWSQDKADRHMEKSGYQTNVWIVQSCVDCC
jgi:hypothetical protein